MPYKDPKSPFWFISYPDPESGKRVRESSGTQNKAEAAALEGKKRLERHRVKRWGEKPSRSYDELMTGYLRETASKKSHDRDLTSAAALHPHFTETVVAEWTLETINGYKALRRATITARRQRVSEATIAKELTLLSTAIKYANHHWGWELPNLIPGRIPLSKTGKLRWLTREESEAFLAAAGRKAKQAPHLADFISLGLSTGMRRDEMLKLEWSRVDFGQRLIYLDPENQKSGRSGSIPLNETALRALRARLEHKRVDGHKSAYVFANEQGERIASIKTTFYKTARKVGLTDISPHTLRHTFTAWLVQAGVPLRTVCELCRHKDIRTTMRYAHLAPENAREAIKVLDVLAENSQTKNKGAQKSA